MNAQSSMEFIILLAAVSAFAVAVLSASSGMSSQVRSMASLLPNISSNSVLQSMQPAQATQGALSLYLPTVSYVNESNEGYAIAYVPGGFTIRGVSADAPNMALLPYDSSGQGQPYVISVPFVPNAPGKNAMSIRLTATNGTSTLTMLASGETESVDPAAQYDSPQQPYATIVRNNESMIYGLSGAVSVQGITQSTGCTKSDFWGNPYPIAQQCGNAFAYMRTFDDYCYDRFGATLTYCFYTQGSALGIRKVNYTYSPYYNISLSVMVGNATLLSGLTSSREDSSVFYGGEAVGTASVLGDVASYGRDPAMGVVMLGNATAVRAVNMSYYQTFEQYLNDALAVIGYYNNTAVDSSQLSSVQQSVSSYDAYAAGLGKAPNATAQCSYSRALDSLVCRPVQGFAYSIDVNLSRGIYSGNTVIYTEGSSIRLR